MKNSEAVSWQTKRGVTLLNGGREARKKKAVRGQNEKVSMRKEMSRQGKEHQ